MNESTRAVILLILIFVLLLGLAFYASTYLLRRAIKDIIRKFQDADALTPATAKTFEELGLVRKGLIQLRFFRDYRPAALGMLMKQEVIQMTEDNRAFLSEENLANSDFAKKR